MKAINLLIISILVSPLTKGQAGGKALVFDGVDNNIELNSSFQNQDGTKSFSFCAWVKSTNVSKGGQRILCDDQNDNKGYSFSLGDGGAGKLRFFIRGVSNVVLDVPAGSNQLTNNTWYHVAAVYNQPTRERFIYVNGILAASVAHGAGQWASNEVDNGPTTIGGEADGSRESANRFQGEMDEISYWNIALSQSEIRSLMCKSLTGAETGLAVYYNFDAAAVGVNQISDLSGNGFNGSMKNMNATEIIESEIPIGNESTYTYSSSDFSLSSVENGSLTLSSIVGNPDGVHIYRVDSPPNFITGLSGVGSNDTYFGVFIAGGTSPSYTVAYNYSNFPVAVANENDLVLNTRTNNTVTNWNDINATLSIVSNTLLITGVNDRAEFILTNPIVPLPIDLLSFEANINVDRVELKWVTSSEVNNDFFTVEKSVNAIDWEELIIAEGAGNSNQLLDYFEIDSEPIEGISYYRLKQTDFDGGFNYFNIVPVTYKKDSITDPSLHVYPMPAKVGEEINVQFNNINTEKTLVVLRNSQGKEFYSKVYLKIEAGELIGLPINTAIPSGLYLITATSKNQIYSQKLIVK